MSAEVKGKVARAVASKIGVPPTHVHTLGATVVDVRSAEEQQSGAEEDELAAEYEEEDSFGGVRIGQEAYAGSATGLAPGGAHALLSVILAVAVSSAAALQ